MDGKGGKGEKNTKGFCGCRYFYRDGLDFKTKIKIKKGAPWRLKKLEFSK
jgi:hypothetical protein